jgi:pSer/pThr/pTyr-binding forkhead associated (FHA) protein
MSAIPTILHSTDFSAHSAYAFQKEILTTFSHVFLKATAGDLKGREFVLDHPGEYTLGRSRDCAIRVPDALCMVSRRHCRIAVEPLSVRVRDLDSLNGTYVNGEKVGQRPKGQTAAEAPAREHPERVLSGGDQLQLGGTVFKVELVPHPPCAESEPRDQEKLWGCEEVLC